MIGRLAFLLLLLFGNGTALAAPADQFPYSRAVLSDQASISVLTCGPGTEAYSLFGHSALRVRDPRIGLDWVYNFGTFDPGLPFFGYHFLRGDLQYWVSVAAFDQFLWSYQVENRSVSEQVLALAPADVNRMYQSLHRLLNSPARLYQYQFFTNNCSTRLFDLLEANLTEPLQWNATQAVQPPTYRQLIAPYLDQFPWINLGIQVLLGSTADQQTGHRQRLFLPAELERALTNVRRGQQRLVARTNPLFLPARVTSPEPAWWARPSFVLPALVLVALGIATQPTLAPIGQRVLLLLIGLPGCLLLFLCLFSLHKPLQNNYQILWLLPTHLLFIWPRSLKAERRYAVIASICWLTGVALACGLGYLTLLPERWILPTLAAAPLALFFHSPPSSSERLPTRASETAKSGETGR